jgi:hypothetical protein
MSERVPNVDWVRFAATVGAFDFSESIGRIVRTSKTFRRFGFDITRSSTKTACNGKLAEYLHHVSSKKSTATNMKRPTIIPGWTSTGRVMQIALRDTSVSNPSRFPNPSRLSGDQRELPWPWRKDEDLKQLPFSKPKAVGWAGYRGCMFPKWGVVGCCQSWLGRRAHV